MTSPFPCERGNRALFACPFLLFPLGDEVSGYPGLVLRHLERERGGKKKGPNAHPIDGVGPSKFQKRGEINQGKAPSKGCAYKLAPQRHLVF